MDTTELTLDSPVTKLKNVGAKRAALYDKLGIHTILDLLRYYPRSYVDYTAPVMAADAPDGETCVIRAAVTRRMQPAPIRKGLVIYKVIANDGISNIQITIFNNEYAYYGMKAGEEYAFCGKFSVSGGHYQLALSSFVPAAEADTMRPVYNLTEGLSNGMISNNMREAVDRCAEQLTDPMPLSILREEKLCQLRYAIENIHFPKGKEAYEIARYRLVYEEFFTLSLALIRLRGREKVSTAIQLADTDLTDFYTSLPFTLTNAQQRAIREILADMQKSCPMNRLLQGDVGSGKTMVAAAAVFSAAKNGFQSAIMAPTEILAEQHFLTFSRVLEPLGIHVCLLTGSLSPKQKEILKEDLANGVYQAAVGTHALVQDSTKFRNLGLVITDEQHRFGVEQRRRLAGKGDSPHCLVMSATPIPRTLALIVYGDLDISILDELPKGRQPIDTLVIHSDKRERALHFIREHIEAGEQAYIVCPLVEDSEESDLLAASQYRDQIARDFEGIPVGLLHGRMKPAEKEEVMTAFQKNEISLLVATTVVEVGVDVPNATVMMVENAERFGLAQLHQLRGRVGRGSKKSYCILVSDHDGEENRRRLKVMKSTSDGFVIAREDLKLRGSGDFFGSRQHGMPALAIADLFEDADLFQSAQNAAHNLLREDPELCRPENSAMGVIIDQLFAQNKDGWN
ncbi:MAG: ATP-dependent DNA helicase RecG [Candidatus Merdivicinus sp.]